MGRNRRTNNTNKQLAAEQAEQKAELEKKEAEVKAEKERVAIENTEKLRNRRRKGRGRATLIATSERGITNSNSSLY